MHKILANTIFLGKEVIYLPDCHSTNDLAMEMYRQKKAGEGSIVITDKQTRGRGQRGNKWLSEPGANLTFTLVLTPLFLDATEQFDLNMAISLGVREAFSEYVKELKVKWPNDIVHESNHKLGGILMENAVSNKGIELAIVGIGLNINQLEFPFPHATSLAILAGSLLDKEEIFKTVIQYIEKYYLQLKRGKNQDIRDLYLYNLYRYGEWADFDDGHVFSGKITGLSAEGKIIIEKKDKSQNHYAFKEVKFLY